MRQCTLNTPVVWGWLGWRKRRERERVLAGAQEAHAGRLAPHLLDYTIHPLIHADLGASAHIRHRGTHTQYPYVVYTIVPALSILLSIYPHVPRIYVHRTRLQIGINTILVIRERERERATCIRSLSVSYVPNVE